MSFRYQGSGGGVFECKLVCRQCEATVKSGSRCKRTTCFQLPYCSQHVKLILQVEVKTSKIPNSGLGLFALREFRKGDVVAPYGGEVVDLKEHHRRYGATKADLMPYGIRVTNDAFIDGACFRGSGAYANSNPGKNNAKFAVNTRTRTANVVATKTIAAGNEVFVSYGSGYFKGTTNVEFSTSHRARKKSALGYNLWP